MYPPSPTLRAALWGCGKIGWSFQEDEGAASIGVCTHAAAWSAVAGVQLVAVGDVKLSSAEQCAQRWNVPTHCGDLDALLACSPDIVSIASPDAQHFDDVKRCLEHASVKAVLAEKPLANSAAEAAQLEALAQQLGKVIVVNYSRRFCDFYVLLRQRILDGEFGALRLGRCLYTKGALHNGSHFVDLMRYLFGELRAGSATVPAWLSSSVDEVDPGMDVCFTAPNGASIVMHHIPAENFTVFEMDLCFDNARFVFLDGGNTVQEFAIVTDQPFVGYKGLAQPIVHENAMKDYLLRAAENVAGEVRGTAFNLSPASESAALLATFDSLTRKRS